MIIADIVSQHAEESAFLWLLRANAIDAPHYDLNDLANLEERIDAHIDGLRVAGEEAWPFCVEGLKHEEVGEVFAAGLIALDADRDDWLAPVIETVAVVPETISGLISALGWVGRENLQGRVLAWLQSDDPLLRQIGLGACTAHGVDCGSYLTAALDDSDAGVRARALRHAGEVRRDDVCRQVVARLDDDEFECRFWAARSAILLGDYAGIPVLQDIAILSMPHSNTAQQLVLHALDTRDAIAWVRELHQQPELTRVVVQATGIIGDPNSVPWLIEQTKEPELARAAGEAIAMITGVDLAYQDLETDWPTGFEAGPTEQAADNDVAMDADEDLAWPSSELLTKWWATKNAEFVAGTRYLCGRVLDRSACLEVLKSGLQRQRRAAALAMALLSDDVLFNTEATARRQMKLLGLR